MSSLQSCQGVPENRFSALLSDVDSVAFTFNASDIKLKLRNLTEKGFLFLSVHSRSLTA
jgi:hypothetical protein